MRDTFLRISVLACALAGAPLARAEGADTGELQSTRLFEQGVTDMEAGRFEKACPAVQQSYKLDPRPGTLFTLAECEAQRGRLATAVERYTEFLALYRNFDFQKRMAQKDRADVSTAQIAALVPLVPRLTLRLPAGERRAIVRRDGEIVPDPLLGTPLAVDPGEHVVTTQVDGGAAVERRVTVAAGEKKELVLSVHDPESARQTHRTWAIVSASVGAAGALFGGVTGALAIERKGVVDRECTKEKGGYECSTQQGVDAGEQLKALGTMSTVGLAVGLVGLSTSSILLLTMPAAQGSGVRVSVSAGGVALSGTF